MCALVVRARVDVCVCMGVYICLVCGRAPLFLSFCWLWESPLFFRAALAAVGEGRISHTLQQKEDLGGGTG